jgi:hypothetical protein
MSNKKSRLNKIELREYHSRLLRLERMGIPIGCTWEPTPESARLDIQQVGSEFARIYELPGQAIGVVVPAKMTVRKSGILITDSEMKAPWDVCELDLGDPSEISYYEDLIRGLPYYPPAVLNHLLTHEFPLRPRQSEGFLIAHGYGAISPAIHDDALIVVKLSLRDQRDDEYRFDFKVSVDRSVKRRHEQRNRRGVDVARATRSGGLYDEEGRRFEDQTNVDNVDNADGPKMDG